MPCGDPGGGGQCHLLHVRDLSTKELEAVIRKRKAEKKRAAEVRKKKETERERRERLSEEFLTKALKALKGQQFATKQQIVVVFNEDNRIESDHWRWGELQINLQKWLKACRPFPTQMTFEFQLMKGFGREGAVPVLWSWHSHKR